MLLMGELIAFLLASISVVSVTRLDVIADKFAYKSSQKVTQMQWLVFGPLLGKRWAIFYSDVW